MQTSPHHCLLCFLFAGRTLCFQSVGAFCHYIDPANRSEKFQFGRELHLLDRSLRHIAARSNVATSGTPDFSSPFPGSEPICLLLACFHVEHWFLIVFLVLQKLLLDPRLEALAFMLSLP